VVLAACAAEENDRPWQNPGGGGGGGGGPGRIDAAVPIDAPVALVGQICVVTDLRLPDACPEVAEQEGVTVGVSGTPETAISDGSGRFTLPATGDVVLEAGAGSTTLLASRVPATVGGAVVNTPIARAQDFVELLDAIEQTQPDDTGVVLLYVADGDGPVNGVVMESIAGATVVPFYDAGARLTWVTDNGTGTQGAVLFLGVPPGDVSLAGMAPGNVAVAADGVPVDADAITFVRVRLAGP
jgi:hypothetical protein